MWDCRTVSDQRVLGFGELGWPGLLALANGVWRIYRRGRGRLNHTRHDLGRIAAQAECDTQLGRTRFYVYVLATDYEHYVGHTWDVGSRVRQYPAGRVGSTRGGRPVLLWQSRPFATREDAARFETSLKSLRDGRSGRFAEIAGVAAAPWSRRGARGSAGGMRGAGSAGGVVVTGGVAGRWEIRSGTLV